MARPGVQVNYSPVSGIVVQVYSDASVRQIWPVQRIFPSPLVSTADDTLGNPQPLPGDAEDLEVARMVTAFGVLTLERLSGRREVYHPDGIRAVRNPTLEEITTRRDKLREARKARRCDVGTSALLRRMERIYAAWKGQLDELDPEEPSEQEKAMGLPGHWKVTLRDGKRLGRILKPPEPEKEVAEGDAAAEAKAESVGDQESQPKGSKETIASGEGEGEEEDEDAEEQESEEEEEGPPELIDIFEGWLVDDGDQIEYEIDAVPTTFLRDPHTGQHTISNEEGLLIVSEPDGRSVALILPDGTRVIKTMKKEGYTVVVDREGSARVNCCINDKAYNPSAMLQVECDDGTSLDIVPRRLNDKAELTPSDPSIFLAGLRGEKVDDAPVLDGPSRVEGSIDPITGNSDPRNTSFCTNASVLLRRPEGYLLNSKGAGEVEIISNFDVATMGEEAALKSAQDRGGVYVANCGADSIMMRDDDGNAFEVRGDQTLDFKLAVSMGDDFMSPRCSVPKKPFKHPDSSFLPLPNDAPPPRLFVVYGDGEAEELLLTRDAHEALRLAQNSDALVETDRLRWPMQGCETHTIHRIAALDPVDTRMRPLNLPPAIAGMACGASFQRTYTEFRQFVEYPSIDEKVRQEFHQALVKYAEAEEQQKLRHNAYGQGFEAKRSKGVGVAVEENDKADRGGA
eukprot:TRINITY_DN4253_c0_g3_i1.p1 TRINITY_DN4253_c0_g3~~TRINITY_DN4253_c0_g3_i1.p1  ORF type:complete len:797 (+),score=205.33 TRINITY_DN4253_c0_g3_i1:341-2392(+)